MERIMGSTPFQLDDPRIDPDSNEFDQLCFNLSIPPCRRLEQHSRFWQLVHAIQRSNKARGITPRWSKPPQPEDTSEFDRLSDEEKRQLMEMKAEPLTVEGSPRFEQSTAPDAPRRTAR